MGIRTPDPDLAKVVLYQLSYAPIWAEPRGAAKVVGLSGLEPETSRLSGVCSNQLSYKPIGFRSASSDVHMAPWPCRHRTIRYHLSICQSVPGTVRLADRDPWREPAMLWILVLYRREPAGWQRARCEGETLLGGVPGGMPNSDGHIRGASRHLSRCIPRKEVIQPHLPIRLPCYDLVPLTASTFGAPLLAVGTTTSGENNSGGLTGGVYKAQEHIHRGVADPRLLAIPASCGRIAAHNPN